MAGQSETEEDERGEKGGKLKKLGLRQQLTGKQQQQQKNTTTKSPGHGENGFVKYT